MESPHIYHEESINSSDDDHDSVDLGIGRSYECVFCKRGFNTAQALGGHMNIHRKDRARNKPANNTSKQEEMISYTGPRLYQQINMPANHRFPSHDHHHHHHHQQQQQQSSLNNYATFFPGSSSSATRPVYHDDGSDSDHRQPSDPMAPGDWRMSLEFTPSVMIMDDLGRERSQGLNQKEDLDLELRLGYD